MLRSRLQPSIRFALSIALTALALIALTPNTGLSHVGSPDVFYEGDAGPYHVFVTIMIPQVIPGVADVQIRTYSADIHQIATTVTWLSGPGSQFAPVPDIAKPSPVDGHLFTSSLWLMASGSLRVVLRVEGALGTASLSIPVPSFPRRVLTMPSWLGAILSLLTAGLAAGAILIVGAAAREATLPPGAAVGASARRRGRIAMIVTAAVVVSIFFLAIIWWNSDAQSYAATTKQFKPPKLALALVDGNHLAIRPSSADQDWLQFKVMESIVPDHGHLMHLFLVRTPGLDRIWHLHPKREPDGSFLEELPSLEPGRYRVFADIVSQSGFPWTLVGTIDLPRISGVPLSGDDCGGVARPLTTSSNSTVDVLNDGTRVVWHRETAALRANVPMIMRFEVQDQNSKPALDVEPYMGMAAHAAVISSDLQVFVHLHPSGSVPMAALTMASNYSNWCKIGAVQISPELSIPYGFPNPGLYRVFLQFRRAEKIETAYFDTVVN